MQRTYREAIENPERFYRESIEISQTIDRQYTEIIQKIYRKSKENLHTIYRHATAIHRLQQTQTKPATKPVTSLRTIAGFEKISCIFIGGKVASYRTCEMERHEFLLRKRNRPLSAKERSNVQRICISADGLMVSKSIVHFYKG